MKKLLSMTLCLSIVFSLLSTVSASELPMTVDEAKTYLENYYVTRENSEGKEYSVQYIFSSEDDLNSAAQYIADNGLAAFNAALDIAIEEAVSNEPPVSSPFSIYYACNCL